MADSKISALPQGNPASGDVVPYETGGSATQGALASAVGTRVLLAELTAASSASLNFLLRNVGNYSGDLFQSDFDEYVMEAVTLVPSTALTFFFRCSTDGATFDSGANYDWTWGYVLASSAGAIGTNGDTALNWRNSTTTIAANTSWNGHFRWYGPNTALHKQVTGQINLIDNSSGLICLHGGGRYKSTTSVRGMQVGVSTGTITSGNFRIYGVRK